MDYCFITPETPEKLRVQSSEFDEDWLVITWDHDAGCTQHNPAELRRRCLTAESRQERKSRHIPWLADDAHQFRWFDAGDLADPLRRMDVFLHIRDHGLALVNGLPPEPGRIESLLTHFGPARQTHFGYLFDIRSRPSDNSGNRANVGATASNAQSPHADEGWRHGPPGISLFHCIKSSPSGGGSSVFVDAVSAAEELRRTHPESFRFLATTPLLFEAERNPQERFRARGRVIATDTDGVVRGVRITDRTIPPLDLPVDCIENGYRALRDFYGLLTAPQRRFEYLLKPGDLVIFDNHCVLHARHAFDPQAGERWLQQLSVDREEFHNRMRQLADEIGREDVSNWEPDAGVLSFGLPV